MKRVFIFVNGILSWPSDADGWTDRAVTWTNIRTETAVGEKYEYICGPLTRRLKQQRRAEGLAKMCRYYADCVGQDPHHTHKQKWQINLVGHSNGCDIILRTLALLPEHLKIESVHLIAAACEADFDTNGLNRMLWNNRLHWVEIYTGGQDYALKFAKLTSALLNPFGLGYGSLGLTGPGNVNHHRVVTNHEPFFGHSSWFEPVQFPTTLTHITKPFLK
jgi:pimeloyl-ACP methyl ester carboxylesterase